MRAGADLPGGPEWLHVAAERAAFSVLAAQAAQDAAGALKQRSVERRVMGVVR
jgi:hypothetical protein